MQGRPGRQPTLSRFPTPANGVNPFADGNHPGFKSEWTNKIHPGDRPAVLPARRQRTGRHGSAPSGMGRCRAVVPLCWSHGSTGSEVSDQGVRRSGSLITLGAIRTSGGQNPRTPDGEVEAGST